MQPDDDQAGKKELTTDIYPKIPYHGAKIVQAAVRNVIYSTAPGCLRPMSVNMMIKLLIEQGLPEHLAMKLPSQTRKGAPLEAEWKDAFASGRFLQRLGRYPAPAAAGEPPTTCIKVTSIENTKSSTSRKAPSFDGWVPDKRNKVNQADQTLFFFSNFFSFVP